MTGSLGFAATLDGENKKKKKNWENMSLNPAPWRTKMRFLNDEQRTSQIHREEEYFRDRTPQSDL